MKVTHQSLMFMLTFLGVLAFSMSLSTLKADEKDRLREQIEELQRENQSLRIKYSSLKMKYETLARKIQSAQAPSLSAGPTPTPQASQGETSTTQSTLTTQSGTTNAIATPGTSVLSSKSSGNGTYRIRIESVKTATPISHASQIRSLESRLSSLKRQAHTASERQSYRIYDDRRYTYSRDSRRDNRKTLNDEKSREARYKNEARKVQLQINKLRAEERASLSKVTVTGRDLDSNQRYNLILSSSKRQAVSTGQVYSVVGYKRSGSSDILVRSLTLH